MIQSSVKVPITVIVIIIILGFQSSDICRVKPHTTSSLVSIKNFISFSIKFTLKNSTEPHEAQWKSYNLCDKFANSNEVRRNYFSNNKFTFTLIWIKIFKLI